MLHGCPLGFRKFDIREYPYTIGHENVTDADVSVYPSTLMHGLQTYTKVRIFV